MWVNRLGVAWCALRGAGRGRWVWAVPRAWERAWAWVWV